MNEKAKEALAKWREENKGVKLPVLNPLEKSRHNPKSKALALKAYCWDCAGGSKAEVTNCNVTICPLYQVRPWQKDEKEED